jgi:hypothetical protein
VKRQRNRARSLFVPYVSAIQNTLEDRASFATLTKVYRATAEGERRYSPAEVVSTEVVPVMGDPDPKKICTSHIERQNLTLRMQIRRLTRLTNAFSKKWENHWAALCLHFAYYNFCRDSPHVARYACDGSGDLRSSVGTYRTAVLNPLRDVEERL